MAILAHCSAPAWSYSWYFLSFLSVESYYSLHSVSDETRGRIGPPIDRVTGRSIGKDNKAHSILLFTFQHSLCWQAFFPPPLVHALMCNSQVIESSTNLTSKAIEMNTMATEQVSSCLHLRHCDMLITGQTKLRIIPTTKSIIIYQLTPGQHEGTNSSDSIIIILLL